MNKNDGRKQGFRAGPLGGTPDHFAARQTTQRTTGHNFQATKEKASDTGLQVFRCATESYFCNRETRAEGKRLLLPVSDGEKHRLHESFLKRRVHGEIDMAGLSCQVAREVAGLLG